MKQEKIKTLIELLEELQNKEFWNDTNLLNLYDLEELEKLRIDSNTNLDICTTTDLLIKYLQKSYIMQDITAWSIQK